MKKKICLLVLLTLMFCFQPCLLFAKGNIVYPGTIFLINGDTKTANIELPEALQKRLFIESEGIETSISADSVDRIAIQTPATTTLEFYYRNNGIKKVWVYKTSEGDNVSAYIGASSYKIKKDGSPHFVRKSMRVAVRKDTITLYSDLPLYLIRKKDKDLQLVTFVNEDKKSESGAFRKGISRVLKNDPMLCEYVREQKWDYNNLQDIVENYVPDRKETQLTINGKVIERKPQKLITDDFNNEMIFFIDFIHPQNKVFNIYENQLNLGIKSSFLNFLTYGGTIGYAKAQYVDDDKLNKKYPELWQKTIEVAPDDFSETTCFNADVFLGGQIPFHVGRFYLIPSAGWNAGTLFSTNFATAYHGLQLSFDLGYKMKYGSVLFAGLVFRQIKPLKDKLDEDNIVFHSEPKFFKYPDVNAVGLRIGYKF